MTPDQHTNQELILDAGDSHQLYVHDWGNPDAATVVFSLHGGPGSASRDHAKHYFDPSIHRVIFHDQRGCGRSTPNGSLEHNTTADLIGDITAIADKLDIERFILTGGSWGSCLALAYALEHPSRVSALVLRGIFGGSQREISWLDKGMFRIFYPEAWQRYLEATPPEFRADPTAYHTKRVLGDDAEAARQSGYAYETLEEVVMSLDDRQAQYEAAAMPEDYDVTGIKMEMYYMQQGCFMPDRHILDNAARLTMPVRLVQGRYDMVCPPATAHELHQLLPDSELVWTTDGHAASHETWTVMRTMLRQLARPQTERQTRAEAAGL